MAIELQNSRGEGIPIFLKKWNVENSLAKGILHDQSINGDFQIDYPLPIVKDTETYSSCRIFLFKNRFGSKEDHCFNLEINKKQSGVIYPIKIYSNPYALPVVGSSKPADFFYRFLHIGFYHLLDCKGLYNPDLGHEILSKADIKIEDLYGEDTVVFLYHNNGSNLDIKKCLPNLLKLGYVPIIAKNDFNEIENINIPAAEHPLYAYNVLDVVKLTEVKSDIIKEKFIFQIFSTILKTPLTPLSRFVLLYQVVELLIDKIALEYYKSNKPFTSDMARLQIAADSSSSYRDVFDNLYEIQKRINNSTKKVREEEKRINKLLTEKCKLDIADYTDFVNEAKKIIGAKKCSDLTEYVYALRNKIIHDYHNLSSQHANIDDLLINLNIEFEKLISDVVIEYS